MKKANSERKKREVAGRGVAGPDLLSMRVQEGRPVLSARSSRTHVSHVLLDRAFADAKPQLEECAADSLRSEDADFAPPSL
jgi:hypothetical protein